MIKEAIVKIVNKEDLSYDEAYAVMNEIMSGETSQTQNAAFLAALSTKSARAETTDEIAGCAAAMRDHATRVDTGMDVLEIVGTGGDNAGSFNISTTTAIIAAAAGIKVAKHGNRAASSLCGTADCLEALGEVARVVHSHHIGDFSHIVGGCFQQLRSAFDAHLSYELNRTKTGKTFKLIEEDCPTESHRIYHIFYQKLIVVHVLFHKIHQSSKKSLIGSRFRFLIRL